MKNNDSNDTLTDRSDLINHELTKELLRLYNNISTDFVSKTVFHSTENEDKSFHKIYSKGELIYSLNKIPGLTLTGSRVFRTGSNEESDFDFFGRINSTLIHTLVGYGFCARDNENYNDQSLSPEDGKWKCVSLTHQYVPVDVFLFDDEGYRLYLRGHQISKYYKLRDQIPDKGMFLDIFHMMCGREIPEHIQGIL